MFLSLFGNLAVIAIVSKNNQMWTTTNFLIANMAASDLMITAFALPREVAEVFIGPRRWLLKGIVGQILCKLVFFLQDLSTAVSMHSLVVIAIDRYRGIVFPFRSPVITTKNCKVIIPIIWVVAMGLHGMYFYTSQLTMSESKWYCTISWAPKFEEKTQVIYFTFLSVVIIFLPLCVILTLYTLILIELRKRKVSKNNALELRSRRRKEDTAIMKRILILVLLFLLCITPVIVSGLVFHFIWDSRLPCVMEHLFPVTKFVFYSNASLNPWVYIVLSERYRQGMKELAKNFTCKDKIELKRASNLSLRKTDKKPKSANFRNICGKISSKKWYNCPFLTSSTLAQCIKTFAYSLIMFLSLFGNLAVIAIVSKNNQMWTTTNFLIANMAASDLMITAFALPREVAEVFIGPRRWLLKGIVGQILCKLVFFLQDLSTAVSMHSLVVIAIDRYRGIVFPFRSPVITTKNCKVIIPIIWVVAMGLHGMYFYTLQLTKSESKWYCTISWAPKFEEKTQVIYFTFLSVVIIFLPLCVILTLYTLILIELRKRKVSKNNALELRSRRRKEDTAIMKRILILVLLFILCITPVIVSGLVFHFIWDSRLPCDMEHLFPVTKFVFYSNASLNPWVYIVLSERYRQGMKELAKNFTCKDKIQ
ncbi:unnamed protein product, partial [Porites lobata]